MKKAFSAILTAVMAVSSVSVLPANAEKYGNGQNIVLMGDSIASGYGLEANEYNYGQLCADYINGNLDNLAHSGDTTQDLLNKLESLSADEQSALKNADHVVISIGGNDMMHYTAKVLIKFAVENNLLSEGYTAENVPESPSVSDLRKILDLNALSEFINGPFENARIMMYTLNSLKNNLGQTSADEKGSDYERYIETSIIPNIESAVSKVKAINPNADIVVQTIYNPLQYEQSYLKSLSSTKQSLVNQLKPVFRYILESFNKQISAVEGVKVADVYTEFTATDECAWYFTDMQNSLENMDFHPNKKGHLAIAGLILDTINADVSENGSILRQTYINLDDKENFPAEPLARYEKFKGNYLLGDTNNDNIIDSTDASDILSIYAANATSTKHDFSDSQVKAANVCFDEAIDSSDASYVLAYYAEISTGGNCSFKNFTVNFSK